MIRQAAIFGILVFTLTEAFAQEPPGTDTLYHSLPELPALKTPDLRATPGEDHFRLYGDNTFSSIVNAMPSASLPAVNPYDLGIYNPYKNFDAAFYRSNRFVLEPVGMHYLNSVEGGDLAGLRGDFKIGQGLTASVSTFVSSAFIGHMHPDRVGNLSSNLTLSYEVTDWLTIRGFGQYSAGPGLNPGYSPMIGGANYFGGAARVMITERFGLEGGFTRSYYMGEWTNSWYVVPVFELGGKKRSFGISFDANPSGMFIIPPSSQSMPRGR